MLIQDPIYESIIFNDLEKKVIDTPIFQRLRWVSQLSGAYLVYPSAVHNRFSHSLGAMYLAGEYANHLYPNDQKRKQIIRLSALLHDIAHGPFSHDYDKTVYSHIYQVEKGHDEHRHFLLRYHFSDILKENDISCIEISKIWNGDDKIGKQITQGILGSDRMDYLLRDSHFSGAKLCTFSWKRIIYYSEIKNDELVFPIKLIPEIYLFLHSRNEMYRKVYKHKTSLKMSYLIQKMMENCIKDLNLVERTKKEFHLLNDYTIIGEVMNLKDDHPSKKILIKIFNRDISNINENLQQYSIQNIQQELLLVNWKEINYKENIKNFLC